MERKCKDCLIGTRIVCEFAFAKLWPDKSHDGAGCDNPVDDVAEAWRREGWTLEKAQLATSSLGITLGFRQPPMPKMPKAPSRPTASKIQSGMPTRPKVSASIRRQAELFFSGISSSGGCREAGASTSTLRDNSVPTVGASANFCDGGAA